jgi:hypothetical protein
MGDPEIIPTQRLAAFSCADADPVNPQDNHRHNSYHSRKGEDMDPEKIMDGLAKELNLALKAMAKAKTAEEKLAYSQIVKNLCDSLGVFLGLASEMMEYDMEEN